MNKKIKVLVIVLAVGVVSLIAVNVFKETRNLGVYDKNVADDQLCTLEIAGNIAVTRFNDKKVNWKKSLSYGAGSNRQAVIQIPSGTHELLTTFKQSKSGGSVSVNNIKVTNDFIAGRTYRLTAVLTYSDGETKETWKSTVWSHSPKSVSFKIIDIDAQRRIDEAFKMLDEAHKQ
jgi:hypothetical protein